MTTDTWEKKIGLADMHGTVLTIDFQPPEDEEDIPWGSVAISCGSAEIRCSPTADALRQSAAAFLDLAEAVDEAAAVEPES